MATPFTPTEIPIRPIEDLINIVAELTEDDLLSAGEDQGWDWDAERLTGDNSGWSVDDSDVLDLAEQLVEDAKEDINETTSDLLGGQTDVNGWEDAISVIILGLTLALWPLGRGGVEQVSQADMSRIRRRLNNQFGFLRQFAEQINEGRQSEEQIKDRGPRYADDVGYAREEGRQAAYVDTGFDLVQNVHPGSDQPCPDCAFAVAQGVVPIDEMTQPGQRICQKNDHCHLIYFRSSDTAQNNSSQQNRVRYGFVGGHRGSLISSVIGRTI